MVKRLSLNDIGLDFVGAVSQQDYSKKYVIEGVRIVDSRLMTDDGGSFSELIRCDEEGNMLAIPEFKVRQVNYSEVLPGAVKAFHLHLNQEDVWFVPPTSRLLVGLVDVRAESPTQGVTMRFVLGGGKSQLLYIPRGVAHGACNVWTTPSTMFYFVNQHFSTEQSDENRLPWDFLGAEFWQIQKG